MPDSPSFGARMRAGMAALLARLSAGAHHLEAWTSRRSRRGTIALIAVVALAIGALVIAMESRAFAFWHHGGPPHGRMQAGRPPRPDGDPRAKPEQGAYAKPDGGRFGRREGGWFGRREGDPRAKPEHDPFAKPDGRPSAPDPNMPPVPPVPPVPPAPPQP